MHQKHQILIPLSERHESHLSPRIYKKLFCVENTIHTSQNYHRESKYFNEKAQVVVNVI